jgi:signal transduction histidine kinase
MVTEEQIISLSDTSKTKKNLLSIKTPIKDKDQKIIGIIGISINLEQQDTTDFSKNLIEELIYTNMLSVLRQVKHDIRGPLGAVTGFSELIMAAKNEPNEIEHLADYLLKSCNAMNKFIDSLSNSCVYYQDRSEKHKTSFNLDNLVQNVYDIAGPMAYQHKLKLEYKNELDSQLKLFGFKDVIFRLLMELTNNAIKHTEKGMVNLKVYQSKTNNKLINIDIFNTGKELSKEQISRILNTQELSDDALIQGQGFGLSMVGALAKSIGLDIQVSTSEKLGTIITLILQNDNN